MKLGPSLADSWMGGFLYILGPCGSLQWTVLWGWEFLQLPPHPNVCFQSEALRLYFPILVPWVAWSILLPMWSPPNYLHVNMGPSSAQAAASWGPPTAALPAPFLQWQLCPESSPPGCPPPPLPPISNNVSSLTLVVRLPYSLIFCQFSCFVCVKFVIVFFFGCLRRNSVSTCVSNLDGSDGFILEFWFCSIGLYVFLCNFCAVLVTIALQHNWISRSVMPLALFFFFKISLTIGCP